MNELLVASSPCPQCGAELPDTGDGCSQCQTVPVCTQSTAIPPNKSGVVTLSPGLVQCLNNRWIVAGMLLTIGPLGLPALWFSPRFSRFTKIAVSVVFFLATAVLPILAIWYWCDLALRPLVDAMNSVNETL